MDSTDFDVIVVGGGPGGAAAARAAVEEGLETLLVERKKLPRPKPCSGYLFKEALEFLKRHYGAIPEEARCEPRTIKGVSISLPGRVNLDVPIEGENIWRDRFDRWLCECSGAEIWDDTRLMDFAEWRDVVEIVCRRGNRDVRLSTGVLIAADGCSAGVTTRLDPPFFRGVPSVKTAQRYYRNTTSLDPFHLNVFIDPEYGVYPAAYVKDDLLVTDTSVRPGGSVRRAREAFESMLAREYGFQPTEPELKLGCRAAFPAALNRFCTGTDRVLVVGEAAGFVNAMGEGISSALATGRLAGKAAARDGIRPGVFYRESVKRERERTVAEWMLPALMTGKARPELKKTLLGLPPSRMLRVVFGILAWQHRGGIVAGLNRRSIEVMARRLVHGSYDFRA